MILFKKGRSLIFHVKRRYALMKEGDGILFLEISLLLLAVFVVNICLYYLGWEFYFFSSMVLFTITIILAIVIAYKLCQAGNRGPLNQ